MTPTQLPLQPTQIICDLVDAALANRDIQRYLADPKWAQIWTAQGITRHPTVRVEFEQATVIGGIGESLAAAKHKHFGPLLGIEPLGPDDPVHPTRILFIYKATYPYNRRVEQRRWLKRLLGKEHRSQVTSAARSTKHLFLTHYLTDSGVRAIRRRLKMDPGRFWRLAKGKEFLDLPAPPRQLLLFDPEA
jgi:hypothetical protein